MPQLNLYVPRDLEKEIRKEAKQRGKSISAYLMDLFRQKTSHKEWRKDFFREVVGGWKGDFPAPERKLPEERRSL